VNELLLFCAETRTVNNDPAISNRIAEDIGTSDKEHIKDLLPVTLSFHPPHPNGRAASYHGK